MDKSQDFIHFFMEKTKEFPHLRHHSNEVTGLFKGEAGILLWLYHNMYFLGKEDTTPSALSQMIGFSRPATTSLLNSLEEKKLIIREMSRNDRRKQRVILTEKGRQFVTKKMEMTSARLQFLFEHLGKEKSEMPFALLKESLEILSHYQEYETQHSNHI